MDAKQVSKYGPGKRFLPLGDHLVCRLYDDFMTMPRLEDYSYEDSGHLDRLSSFLKDGKKSLEVSFSDKDLYEFEKSYGC